MTTLLKNIINNIKPRTQYYANLHRFEFCTFTAIVTAKCIWVVTAKLYKRVELNFVNLPKKLNSLIFLTKFRK